MVDSNTFKASNGKYYTRALFWEESIEMAIADRAIEPVFSLYSDREGLINFGREYIDSEDPTGYKVAQKLLGSYQLWTLLQKAKWFKAAKKVWDEELDAKLASTAIKNIKEIALDGPPAQKLAASKYLANLEYRKDHKATKGRPTKAQVEQAAKEEADLKSQLQSDYERIKLVK